MRKKRSDENMLKISQKHLGYELDMLVQTANWLATYYGALPPNAAPMTNAFLESFLIHTRNLLDFLYPQRPKPEDVIAEDFFDDPKTWWLKRHKQTKLLSSSRDRIAKEMVHLTYDRLLVTKERKPWPFLAISADIIHTFNIFCELAPPHRICLRPPAPSPVRQVLIATKFPVTSP